MRNVPLRVHLACLVVAALFSANYIVSKIGMRSFSPLTFAYLRVLGSAAILAAMLPRSRVPLSAVDSRRISVYAIIGVVINQALFLAGLAWTSAHIAAILITTIPVFALAVAIVIGRERATLAKVGGIALAMTGALLVVGGEGFGGSRRAVAGALMLVGNCLAYATYLVISKPAMARLTPRRVLARMFAVATVVMLPLCLWSMLHQSWATTPSAAWISLLLVILGPTVGAYLLNGWALAHSDSSFVAAYTYVQPVLTAVLARIFLKEEIRLIVIAAAVLIFAGVYISGRPAPPVACPEAVPGGPE